MKIFINEYDFTELDNSLDYEKIYYNDLIYSPNHIYIRDTDNYLWKTEILNDTYEEKKINNYNIIIDYSKFNKLEKIYNIPKEHLHISEYIYEKELTNNLVFIKKIIDEQYNYYFEYNGNIDSFSFEELFKFIK
jgi:hypothetical protein